MTESNPPLEDWGRSVESPTEDEIDEEWAMIARESQLRWLRDNERNNPT